MGKDFIPEPRISNAAFNLLVEYGQKFTAITEPPIPVDAILESHLQLSLAFRDLRKELGHDDVLGAISMADKTIFVDDELDPSANAQQLGRYNFTVAHELGHWVLHRGDVLQGQTLFGGKPGLVCRDTNKPPKEIQADKFASHLLMPEEMVRAYWPKISGSNEPYVAVDEIAAKKTRFPGKLPTLDITRKMAAVFAVSCEAMQIRLTTLRMIVSKKPDPTLF